MTVKVLICDDDPKLAELVATAAGLNWPSCETIIAANGTEALQHFEETDPDLVVLDLWMPPPDGYEVCKRIRKTSRVPILIVSAHDTTSDKVRAFDAGADDYVSKPFDALELLARMRAAVRRTNGGPAPEITASGTHITVGDLSLNTESRQVFMKGQPVRLTTTEYRLLEEMARHTGFVLTHTVLLRRVWGEEYEGEEHYLKVFIQRLRKKLGDDTKPPRYIQTEWGKGYRLTPPPPDPSALRPQPTH
jgi:DNA-binding response OmpR family regulator